MPDNKPTSWPPASSAGEPEKAKKPANAKGGWLSLVMVAIGLLFWVFNFLFFHEIGTKYETAFTISMNLVRLACWVAAIVLGIVGRRSLAGKTGIALALVMILVEAIWWIDLIALSNVVDI